MSNDSYLRWLAGSTPTSWWHDSADPGELNRGLAQGACGVTSNPVLTYQALRAQPRFWRERIGPLAPDLDPGARAERLMQAVITDAARKLEPQYRASNGATGYVCAQVNPAMAGDREGMLAMARRFHAWAPNITVKLPATAAGLDTLEECVAEGITVTSTMSFTVPQVVAAAERQRMGAVRAQASGIVPGRCYAVIMIGRLDDYLRDVARDNLVDVSETDIRQAGLAVSKRAYEIFKAEGYEAVLLVAALRGTYHMTELAGGELIMSIHPRYQDQLLAPGVPREQRIERPVEPQVIGRLKRMSEFARSYEPDGMDPEELIAFGLTQRTLSQFYEVGWAMLEAFDAF